MKMEYSIGDIVKLSDKEFYFQTAQFIFPQNLFRIASIEGDKVKLKMLEDEFSCHDIEPVKIDKTVISFITVQSYMEIQNQL